jgi:ribonuclease P protein component
LFYLSKEGFASMLKKNNRGLKERDFARAYTGGKVFRLGPVTVRAGTRAKDTVRFGVVVGTKVSKLAVQRNTLKRRVRAVCAEALKKGLVPKGSDIIVSLFPGVEKVTYAELRMWVLRLIEDAGTFLVKNKKQSDG